MKTPKESGTAFTSRSTLRRQQLFRHWREFIIQLYGNGGMIPTLDWRGCIAIDFVRRESVAFCASCMVVNGRQVTEDQPGQFYFTGREARKVFDRFLALKARFARSAHPESATPDHLRPETWTGRPARGWTESFSSEDIDLAIASLVAYWDACATKPMLAGSDGELDPKCHDDRQQFWDVKPLPKLIRISGLSAGLRRELQKHAKNMPNPTLPADPPVKQLR